MSRPLRIEFTGAWYHVMNRGANRQITFHSDREKGYFLSLLGIAADKFNAEWHAYCLMDNHYHLLLRTPDGNLQRIMRHVNGCYTQYVNRVHGTDGALFRGRYKAVLVEAEHHWLQLSRYIHRNPLEAGMVDRLETYRWSSYPAYVGLTAPPEWLNIHYVKQAISERAQSYADYVVGAHDLNEAHHPVILGSRDFKKKVLVGITPCIDIPELKRTRNAVSISTIITVVCRYTATAENDIRAKPAARKIRHTARAMAITLCHEVGMMPLAEVASIFELASYGSASSSIRAFKQRCREEPQLAQMLAYIKQQLLNQP